MSEFSFQQEIGKRHLRTLGTLCLYREGLKTPITASTWSTGYSRGSNAMQGLKSVTLQVQSTKDLKTWLVGWPATCCRSNWICNCCSCEAAEEELSLAVARRTPDSCESNSAMGSIDSREDGENRPLLTLLSRKEQKHFFYFF